MLTVICVTFAVVSEALPFDKNLFNCLVHDLSERSLLDKTLTFRPEFSEDLDIEKFCYTEREFYRGMMPKIFKKHLSNDPEFADHVDCIWGKLEPLKVDDLYFQKKVYKDDTSMPELRRRKAYSDAVSAIDSKLDHAKRLCLPEVMFKNDFDNQFGTSEYIPMPGEETTSGPEVETTEEEVEVTEETVTETPVEEYVDFNTLEEDYCQIKFLVDLKFINTDIYNITLNPENIDVSKSDCKTIWITRAYSYNDGMKNTIAGALHEPTPKEKNCIEKVVLKTNYAALTLKVWALSANRTPTKLSDIERANFVSVMSSMYQEAMKCVE